MLERGLRIDRLYPGDTVTPEGKYITSKGYYFSMGRGFRVKRVNQKSVSLSPLELVNGKWVETDIIRIPREAVEVVGIEHRTVKPTFGRDNSRARNESEV